MQLLVSLKFYGIVQVLIKVMQYLIILNAYFIT